MRAIAMGRILRMLRIRKDWRQEDVARKAEVSPTTVGRHERGFVGSTTALERHAAALDLRVEIRLVGRSGDLARLADDEHAAIVESLARWFRAERFQTETEASFSEWGERGRIDLLAYDVRSGVLVIVEVKTLLLDMQDLFGGINVKQRLAPSIGRRRGWDVRRSVAVLAVAASARNREVVRSHRALFESFGRAALTNASLRDGPSRILKWVPPARAGRTSWIAGRQRVRHTRHSQSSPSGAYDPSTAAQRADEPITVTT